MIDLHLGLLADAYCPPNGLAHEGARPPGADKDDVSEMLEVEADPATLYVDEEDHVLSPKILL